MRDIDKATFNIGAGIEDYLQGSVEFTEGSVVIMPDPVFGYIGYAPFDWLEAGIALHYFDVLFAEAKIDVVDIFFDLFPFSFMIMGGISLTELEHPIYHAGLTANYRLNKYLQFYCCAGSDNLSELLNLQIGMYISPFQWLGFSTNVKLVFGENETAVMYSLSPIVSLSVGKESSGN